MNEARCAVVKKAYDSLCASTGGNVRLDDIAKVYDSQGDPAVADGQRSEEDSFMEFMSLWDT